MTASLDSSRRIIVVEPHADDAFLSVGAHIAEWQQAGSDVWIWTVFSGTRKRARDAESYAKAMKVKWWGSGCVEGQPVEGPHVTDALLSPEAQFIVPLGITHPEHLSVRKYVEENAPGPIFYYLDQPYAITQKNGPLITTLLEGMRVVSYRKPGIRKYRHIPLFKDQAKFYHYNPVEKLIQTCELLVTQ